MNSLAVSLGFILVATTKAIDPYFLNMAGRGMDPMSRNFINSPLAAEMLDIDVGPGEQNFRERPYMGPGRQDWGFNGRYDSQPRYAQRDWRSQYPSEVEVSLPEKPLSNFNTNQMAPAFDNSFRPSQSNTNQVLPGPDNSFRVQQPVRNPSQFGSSVGDFFRPQQSAPDIGSSQVTPLFADQQPSSGSFVNRVIPNFDNFFTPQQFTPGIAANPLLRFGDLFRPQQSAQGTATDPGTQSLGDLFRQQQLTSNTTKAAAILTNAIRSLLASPNSDVNKMLSLLSPPLMTPPFTAKTQDFGPKANLLNSPQAVPQLSPSSGFPRLSFLGRVMTLGALDLFDMP